MSGEHLTHAQRNTLHAIQTIYDDAGPVLVGATAIGFWIDWTWRKTNDLDLTIALSRDELPARLTNRTGWRRHAHMEQRWFSPDDVTVDLLPISPDILEMRSLTWTDGFRMNMTGFRHVLTRRNSVEIAPGLIVGVAPLEVIALLKMVSFQDRPDARERDLEDLSHIFDGFVGKDDDRNFDPDVYELGLDFEQVSAFTLGRELDGILDEHERASVTSFLAGLDFIEGEPQPALRLMTATAPTSWQRDPQNAAKRISALRSGLRSDVRERF